MSALRGARSGHTHQVDFCPEADVETSFYLEIAPGVRELHCLRRIGSSATQKKELHAACSGHAKIVNEMECHDCGTRFSRIAFDYRVRRGDVKLKAVHLIRFNAAGMFVEIEKLVRPAEGVTALGDAMASLIGPQIKALRAAA
jgi:hypothetical protein